LTAQPAVEGDMKTVGRRQKAAARRAWVEGFCALALVMPAASSALPAGDPDLTVRVRVYNYAQVPSDALGDAEKEASRIFAAAGIDTLWADCSATPTQVQSMSATTGQPAEVHAECAGQVTGATVALRILPRSTPASRAFRDTMFGFADVPSMASVFYGRVEGLTLSVNGGEREAPVILGDVIAHEIGHLLLGTNSHSPSGIMCAKWDKGYLRLAVMGFQKFSPEQSAVMRVTVLRRHAASIQP
jgi:hypothetical protein